MSNKKEEYKKCIAECRKKYGVKKPKKGKSGISKKNNSLSNIKSRYKGNVVPKSYINTLNAPTKLNILETANKAKALRDIRIEQQRLESERKKLLLAEKAALMAKGIEVQTMLNAKILGEYMKNKNPVSAQKADDYQSSVIIEEMTPEIRNKIGTNKPLAIKDFSNDTVLAMFSLTDKSLPTKNRLIEFGKKFGFNVKNLKKNTDKIDDITQTILVGNKKKAIEKKAVEINTIWLNANTAANRRLLPGSTREPGEEPETTGESSSESDSSAESSDIPEERQSASSAPSAAELLGMPEGLKRSGQQREAYRQHESRIEYGLDEDAPTLEKYRRYIDRKQGVFFPDVQDLYLEGYTLDEIKDDMRKMFDEYKRFGENFIDEYGDEISTQYDLRNRDINVMGESSESEPEELETTGESEAWGSGFEKDGKKLIEPKTVSLTKFKEMNDGDISKFKQYLNVLNKKNGIEGNIMYKKLKGAGITVVRCSRGAGAIELRDYIKSIVLPKKGGRLASETRIPSIMMTGNGQRGAYHRVYINRNAYGGFILDMPPLGNNIKKIEIELNGGMLRRVRAVEDIADVDFGDPEDHGVEDFDPWIDMPPEFQGEPTLVDPELATEIIGNPSEAKSSHDLKMSQRDADIIKARIQRNKNRLMRRDPGLKRNANREGRKNANREKSNKQPNNIPESAQAASSGIDRSKEPATLNKK